MLNLKDMMDIYQEEGLASHLAAARVCQDIVLTAISKGPLSRNITSIIKRVENAFKDKQYLRRISGSRQRWIDEDIEIITSGIVTWLKAMK